MIRRVYKGKQYIHVLTLEDAHIYDLERRTNENTKSSEENLNIILVTKKKVSRRRNCSVV